MYRILGIWIKPREHAKVGLVPWNIHLLFNLICLRALAPSLNNAVYIYVFSISPLLVMTARNGFRFQFFPKPLSHSVKLNFDWSTIKRSTEKTPLESRHSFEFKLRARGKSRPQLKALQGCDNFTTAVSNFFQILSLANLRHLHE